MTTSQLPSHDSDQAPRYLRQEQLAFYLAGDKLVCVNGVNGRRLTVPAVAAEILLAAEEPQTLTYLANRVGLPIKFVERFVQVGLLVEAAKGLRGITTSMHPLESAVLRLQASGRARANYPSTASPMLQRRMPQGDKLALSRRPTTRRNGFDEFGAVLARRRSRRKFGCDGMSVDELGELLLDAAAIQYEDSLNGNERRPFPSGGARHPIGIYLVAFNIDGLDLNRVYFFDPTGYLVQIQEPSTLAVTMARQLQAGGPVVTGETRVPAAALILVASTERTASKYIDCSLSIIYRDVGALLQTLYLQATAQSLSCYAVGGGLGATISEALALDGLASVYVGAFLVGRESPARGG